LIFLDSGSDNRWITGRGTDGSAKFRGIGEARGGRREQKYVFLLRSRQGSLSKVVSQFDADGVADHVGGALLTLWAFMHLLASPSR
jgi:hypothetical protein